MADNEQPQAGTTQTEPPATQAAAETTQTPPAANEQATKPETSLTLEVALKELKEARAEAAKYRTSAKAEAKAKEEAEAAALKEQGKFKELYEKAQADLKAKADELAKREHADLQRTVAERVGLPAKFAKRLTGETEAEMEADAKEMLTALPATVVRNDAEKGKGGNGTSSIAGMTKEQLSQFTGVQAKYLPDR